VAAGSAARVTVVIGPDGRIVRAYPKVSPSSHPDQVLADLRSAHPAPG
jgi:peroxiredoxin